jgi:hypothetical protein
MRTSVVYTLHLWPPLGHAKHYTGSARQLPRRLADHALGRGARLTQVQAERGGSWVVAQTEPGGKVRERQLKNEGGASRRCQVCKAVGGYQAGRITAPEALSRAGWERASEHERGLLLDMLGLERAPENMPAAPAGGPAPVPPGVTGGQVRDIPGPRPVPDVQHVTPELIALAEQLEARWAADREAAPQAEPEAGS